MFIRSFLVAAFAVFAYSATAEAAAYITFVAATGVDTRPCTVEAQPCKTLQRAVTVTSAGGTIRILSDLSDNVSITKSLTIEGGGNSMIGLVSINSASAVVILRGLHLSGRGAVVNGIRITSAAAVHIEDCTVERYTSDGIKMVTSTATKLFVSDTVSRANGSDGLYADAVNAKVVIENSYFVQNVSTGIFLNVTKASVTRGDASGNGQVGFALRGYVKMTETTADNNASYGLDVAAGTAILSSAETSGNGNDGLHIAAGAAGWVTDCVFEGGGGYSVNNQGSLFSAQNNTILNSTGNLITTYTLR